jgi:hypothetical protein
MNADEIIVLDQGRIIERGTTPTCSPGAAPTPACGSCSSEEEAGAAAAA